jgi:precorrin-2 dehydrogenase/sirohydrochlorin ferrochelatase
MKYYPVHLDIKNRNCLIVGGGAVGTRKVNTLLECGAHVSVVSPDPTPQLTRLASKKSITLKKRAYRSDDLTGMFLVIGATDDETLNRQVSKDGVILPIALKFAILSCHPLSVGEIWSSPSQPPAKVRHWQKTCGKNWKHSSAGNMLIFCF